MEQDTGIDVWHKNVTLAFGG